MPESSHQSPLERFTGLADIYAQYRPTYPDQAIGFILSHCQLKAGSIMVDVGCGTGISTRLFANKGLRMIGIEPNDEMRQQAEKDSKSIGNVSANFLAGQAEATGLENLSVDAVLSAQAFHWFAAEAALKEFHRILKSGGWVILMWNERDDRDRFTAAYSKLMRSLPDTASVEGPRGQAGNALLNSDLFTKRQRLIFPNEQILDELSFLGRAFSTSYVPKEGLLREQFAQSLKSLFSSHQVDGSVIVRYDTSVYIGQKG
jgi:SAM-dependent methyltransferase